MGPMSVANRNKLLCIQIHREKYPLIDDSLGKLVAEVDEVLPAGGQGVSEERDGVADVEADSRHVGTRISHRIQVLPGNLRAHMHTCTYVRPPKLILSNTISS